MASAVRMSAWVTLTLRLCSQRWQMMWKLVGWGMSRATSWRKPQASQVTTARMATLNGGSAPFGAAANKLRHAATGS